MIFLLFKKLVNILSGKGLGRKFPRLFGLYKLIYRMIRPKGIIPVYVLGNKMYINSQDEGCVSDLLIKGVYEKYETQLFKELIQPGMIVVDVGANIGYYTLIAAKLVRNKGRVYAFEPEPNNYKLLVKNIETNNYTNIIPVPKAISHKEGKVKLFIDKVNLGLHSFSENNVLEKNGSIEVEMLTLDNFFENVVKNNKIDLVKIDTQGAEGLVIEGAEKTLRNNSLKILMEFWPTGVTNVGTDPIKLLQKLLDYGFKINYINAIKQRIETIRPIEIVNLWNRAKDKRRFSINLLLER